MQPLDSSIHQLSEAKIPFLQNEPLRKHTSFKIGGPAALYVEAATAQDAANALAIARQNKLPCMLLGKGSNILFRDEGYRGMIVHLTGSLCEISVDGTRLTAGAGAELSRVCLAAQRAGLAGLEFAFGIPGSVGGAVYMNAGAYGGEIVDVLESITCLDETGKLLTVPAAELELGYRRSILQQRPWCVLSATFQLAQGIGEEILARMKDYMQRREDKQPLDKPSAGSAFKRPPGAFAGALIDQCGLRGHRIGDAAISEKHCGFIVNLGNATCADVLELARQVCERVEQETGYRLEKEIRVIEPG